MSWKSLTLAVCAFPFTHFIHTNTLTHTHTHTCTNLHSSQPSLSSSAYFFLPHYTGRSSSESWPKNCICLLEHGRVKLVTLWHFSFKGIVPYFVLCLCVNYHGEARQLATFSIKTGSRGTQLAWLCPKFRNTPNHTPPTGIDPDVFISFLEIKFVCVSQNAKLFL